MRALVTLAGNPARSTPNSGRIEAALESLELYVAVDIYVNETTRHADVILPAPSPLQRSHYDLAFYQLSVRNVANYSPPVLAPDPGVPDEWATLLRLAALAAGQPAPDDVEPLDRLVAGELLRREAGERALARARARRRASCSAELEPRRGPERLLEILLRCGPYGDGFGARPDGLDARRARGGAARHRPRPARAAPAGDAAHAERADRARPGADRRRRRPPARRARAPARRRRARARRTPPAALEQLVDAQPRAAGQRPGALHAARAPRRRGAARALRRRAGARPQPRGRAGGRRSR